MKTKIVRKYSLFFLFGILFHSGVQSTAAVEKSFGPVQALPKALLDDPTVDEIGLYYIRDIFETVDQEPRKSRCFPIDDRKSYERCDHLVWVIRSGTQIFFLKGDDRSRNRALFTKFLTGRAGDPEAPGCDWRIDWGLNPNATNFCKAAQVTLEDQNRSQRHQLSRLEDRLDEKDIFLFGKNMDPRKIRQISLPSSELLDQKIDDLSELEFDRWLASLTVVSAFMLFSTSSVYEVQVPKGPHASEIQVINHWEAASLLGMTRSKIEYILQKLPTPHF